MSIKTAESKAICPMRSPEIPFQACNQMAHAATDTSSAIDNYRATCILKINAGKGRRENRTGLRFVARYRDHAEGRVREKERKERGSERA